MTFLLPAKIVLNKKSGKQRSKNGGMKLLKAICGQLLSDVVLVGV